MRSLQRVLHTPGAVLLGLGSMIGTGVFIGIGLGASVAGEGVLVAIVIAGLIAACNGLSSAQLAADHPVSGGTYEYGYRYLNPNLGFTAGLTFLIAKSASAATAALGIAAYFSGTFGLHRDWSRPIAAGSALLFTLLVLSGLRRSNRMNGMLVTVAIGALLVLAVPPVFAGILPELDPGRLLSGLDLDAIFHATALLFVAYTGYGRVATLGEEVVNPGRTIPRAVIITIIATLALYLFVGVAAIGGIGGERLGNAAVGGEGPLDVVAELTGRRGLIPLLTLGAVTAMAGVLLNLILGLSRVVLAMGRRGDLPHLFSRIDDSGDSPRPAVIAVGVVVTLLTLSGSMMTTWSLSAFSVLIYYGITNLSALRLEAPARRYPRFIPLLGLVGCFGLAWWVDPIVLAVGTGVVVIGLGIRWMSRGRGVTE